MTLSKIESKLRSYKEALSRDPDPQSRGSGYPAGPIMVTARFSLVPVCWVTEDTTQKGTRTRGPSMSAGPGWLFRLTAVTAPTGVASPPSLSYGSVPSDRTTVGGLRPPGLYPDSE